MFENVARLKHGEPVFFYAWAPSWMTNTMVPGKDVVWLPTPFDALPGMAGWPRPKLLSSAVDVAVGVVARSPQKPLFDGLQSEKSRCRPPAKPPDTVPDLP